MAASTRSADMACRASWLGARSTPGLVAGGATALVECAAILGGAGISGPEQEPGQAERAIQGAKQWIFHIRDGFYHVGQPEAFA